MKTRAGRWVLLLAVMWITCSTAGAQGTAVLLADPGDPYYALAEEIAQAEGLLIVHSLDQALAQEPSFLLWVVSPGRLSDQAMIDHGLAVRDRASAISTGILSGATLEEARALWQRAGEARGQRVVAVNAANPAGHIEAGITELEEGNTERLPLTKTNLVESLQRADYLTFTGHGSSSYLRLDDETTLRASDLPALPPQVVATGSCNTFRPWEEDSIALAFVRRGAAAYAGFVYSPNEGYLMGEFDGLPLRYTWPGFPIGHVVQAQNRGTLQGFASLPYYHLLGDPRLGLQAEAPYRLVGVQAEDGSQVQHYTGAPAGVIPVRLPGGAHYSFVEVQGVTAGWQGDLFYNSRLQMVDVGPDKFLLFEHPGGDFVLRLRPRPSWAWVVGDLLLDSLDGTLLFLQDNDGSLIMLVAGGLALLPVLFLLARRGRRGKPALRSLALAALFGLGAAVLHALYALARLDEVTMTSKNVAFGALSPVSTFLLVTCAAFLFVQARSWWGRAVALAVGTLPALAPAVLLLAIVGVADDLLVGSRMGTGLWNTHMALQPLIALAVLGPPLAAGLTWLRRAAGGGLDAVTEGTRPAEEAWSGVESGDTWAVVTARILFALNAAAWILLGVSSLLRLRPAGGASVGWVVTILMFGNAVAMAWFAWVLGKRRTLWYWLAVAVVAINVLLSVTDQFGPLDLVVLLADAVLLILLLAARRDFLPVQMLKTEGEAMTYEKRRSF